MHIYVSNLTIIGSDNGLLSGWHQAIIWTNAGILLIEPLRTNFSEIIITIQMFPFKKMHLKMLSEQWWPFCLGFNVLTCKQLISPGAKFTQHGGCRCYGALAMAISIYSADAVFNDEVDEKMWSKINFEGKIVLISLIVSWWCHMAIWNFFIIGLGNGLSPATGPKPYSKLMLMHCQL